MRHLPLILLASILLWAPLPFGSVTPWAVTLLVVLIVVLAALALVGARQPLPPETAPVVLALAGLGALGMLQASALAGRWLGFLGGGATAQIPPALSDVAQPGLSLAPALSRQAAVGWWVVALLFVASVVVGRERRTKTWLLIAAVAAVGFQALYGLRQWRLAPGEILGHEVAGPPRLRGTFVNADHLAILFEIMMAICLAWGWWAWRRSRREPRFVQRMLWLVPPWLGWFGALGALVGTGSRAALAAAALGLVVQSALLFPRRRWLAPTLLLAGLLAGGAWVLSQGPNPRLGRQLSRPTYELLRNSRFEVWGPALELWRGSPLLGTGLGTFEEAFPRVQPPALMKDRWGRAHNDPLELLVTGGLVAVGLLAVAVVWLVRRLWRVYRSGARTASRAAALAALAALPPVLLHEGADFGLTVPANALFFVALMGVGAAGPTMREQGAAPLHER